MHLWLFKCGPDLRRDHEPGKHPDVLWVYHTGQPGCFYISGIPVDLVHALSTVIFLWFLSRPLLEKLERIKKKYGLIESGKEEML